MCLHTPDLIFLNIPILSSLNYSTGLKPRHRAFSVELLKDGEGPRQRRHFFKTPIVSCWLTRPSWNSNNKSQEENLHLNVIIYSLLPRLTTRHIRAPTRPPWKHPHKLGCLSGSCWAVKIKIDWFCPQCRKVITCLWASGRTAIANPLTLQSLSLADDSVTCLAECRGY